MVVPVCEGYRQDKDCFIASGKGVSLFQTDEDTVLSLFPLIFYIFQDLGFHNKTVIRILIARSEIDLMTIRKRYKERYGKSLFHDIKVSVLHVIYFDPHFILLEAEIRAFNNVMLESKMLMF